MQSRCCRLLAGLVREVPCASAQVPGALYSTQSTQTAGSVLGSCNTSGSSLLAWLSGPFGFSAPTLHTSPSTQAARRLHASGLSSSNTPGPSDDCESAAKTGPSDAPASRASDSPRTVSQRSKAPRHGRNPAAPPSPHTPAARSSKDKQLKPHVSKSASAAAAAKAGGQRPLPPEARHLLDAQVAQMLTWPAPGARQGGPAAESLTGAAETSSAAVGPTVRATGFYIGHPIVRTSADALADSFRKQPLAPGVSLTGVHPGPEHTLIILTAPAPAPAPAADGTSAAADGRPLPAPSSSSSSSASNPASPAQSVPSDASPSSTDDGPAAPQPPPQHEQEQGPTASDSCTSAPVSGPSPAVPPPVRCMAVMFLEYGGVAFFNVPEGLMLAALARVAAAVLPAAKQAGLQLPRWGAGAGELEGWRAVAAEKLHREEQLFVVDRGLFSSSRNHRRWIAKMDDALRIWEWDSINLETAACVITQSAAIRYYNQECEAMCERYETIMPLEAIGASTDGGGGGGRHHQPLLRRLLGGLTRGSPSRSQRHKLPLHDLQRMVFECSGINVRLYSRLGLREPPASTWESARHHAVWDAMRHEFELDERRDTLMEKSDLLKQSCLDLISANNDSFTRLSEIMIIALISTEIFITLTGMHGVLGFGAAPHGA